MALLKFSEIKPYGIVWNSLTTTGSIEQNDLDEPFITDSDFTDITGLKLHFYYNPISKIASITYTRDNNDSAILRANFIITCENIRSGFFIKGLRNITFEENSKFINDLENCKLQPQDIQFFLKWAGNNEVIG